MLARRHLVLAPVSLLVALAFPALTNGCSGDSLVTGGDGGTEGSSAVPIEGGSGDGGVGGEACGPANVGGSNTSKVADRPGTLLTTRLLPLIVPLPTCATAWPASKR